MRTTARVNTFSIFPSSNSCFSCRLQMAAVYILKLAFTKFCAFYMHETILRPSQLTQLTRTEEHATQSIKNVLLPTLRSLLIQIWNWRYTSTGALVLGCTHVGTEPQLPSNLSASNINMSTSTEVPHRQDRENLLVGYEMLLVVFLAKISLPFCTHDLSKLFQVWRVFREKQAPKCYFNKQMWRPWKNEASGGWKFWGGN